MEKKSVDGFVSKHHVVLHVGLYVLEIGPFLRDRVDGCGLASSGHADDWCSLPGGHALGAKRAHPTSPVGVWLGAPTGVSFFVCGGVVPCSHDYIGRRLLRLGIEHRVLRGPPHV